MRVLLTGTSYFPEFSAGTEVYMRYVSRYLLELGDAVRIACGGNDYQGTPAEPKWSHHNFEFEGIPVTRLVRNASQVSLDDSYSRNDPERHAQWETLFNEFAPELVFTVGRGPALMGDVELIAKSAGVPVVATLIHPDQVCPKGPRLDAWGNGCVRGLASEICCACVVRSRSGVPGLHLALKAIPVGTAERWLPQRGTAGRLRTALQLPRMVDGFLNYWQELRESVSLFVAHSEAAVELLLANGVPAARIRLSAPGLEPRQAATKARHISRPLKFAFVGRLCGEKGVRTLVKAWQSLGREVEAELHFWGNPQTGEPDVIKAIENLAASDPRVIFHGPFERAQTDTVYDSMDLLVVPSEWFDNCPFVISEAFAAGVPVVGTDFGGIRTMIQHEVNGLLFPMRDARALANILARLAAAPESVQVLVSNLRPPRDAREHVRELRNIFEDAVVGPRPLSS
jgi:glycosyltransferase involved in cell wall biosynthesis